MGAREDAGLDPWLTLAGIWVLSFVVNAYLIVPSSVLPLIMADTGVDHATAAWVISGAFLSWSLTNLGVGVGIDRYGDYTVCAVGTLVVAVAGVWGYYAGVDGAFGSLVASRVVAGVAIGGIWTAGSNLVGRTFHSSRAGTALGLFTTSAPAGLAVGQLFGPRVADAAGWPVAVGLFGVAALGGFALFALAHGRTDPVDAPAATSAFRNVRAALSEPAVRYGCAFGFAAYSLFLIFNSWLPTYLSQDLGVSLATGGVVVAVFPAMGVVSRAAGGVVSDRYLGQRRLPIVVTSFLVTLPVVAVVAFVTDVTVLLAALVVAGFAVQLSIGILYSYVREAVDETIAGTALSLLGAASIFGAFSAPIAAGSLIEGSGYVAAFGYAAALAAVGLALTWLAPAN